MDLPEVIINISDGALGRTVATEDGIGGLVVTGVAATGLALNTAKQIFSLEEAETLGITATTHAHAHHQISEYYGQAGVGAELWLYIISEATTHAAVFVNTTGPMQKLLDAADGRITIAATSMGRVAGYAPTMVGLVDYDLAAVAAQAQIIANVQTELSAPVRIILDGSYLLNPLTNIVSIKGSGDRVSVFCGTTEVGKRSSSMGRFLGRLAAIPVHQSIGRVKTGQFSANGGLTSGLGLSNYSKAQLGALHNAGYIVPRKFIGKAGVFLSFDTSLALATSDFTSIALGRVIDKAVRLTYGTYVEEINDNIEIDPLTGKLLPTAVSYIEDKILRTLKLKMLAEGNCSGVFVMVNPSQDILATEQLVIVLKIVPLGTLKEIVVKLGFYNPANA